MSCDFSDRAVGEKVRVCVGVGVCVYVCVYAVEEPKWGMLSLRYL